MTDFETWITSTTNEYDNRYGLQPEDWEYNLAQAAYEAGRKSGLEEAASVAVNHAVKMQYDNRVNKRIAEAEELGARRVAAAIRGMV